jgi:serine/threonine-protein kinase
MTPTDASRDPLDVPTTTDARRSEPRPSRCRVAHPCSTGVYRGEIASLLHHRLRIVSVLMLVPGVFMLLMSLLGPGSDRPAERAMHLAQAASVVVLAIIAAVMWQYPRLSYVHLRITELVLFGTLVLFFAYLQTQLFARSEAFTMAEQSELPLSRILIHNTTLRWFFLIVVYGVFIPNSALRCGLVTGCTTLLAVGLTFVAAAVAGRLDGDVLTAIAMLGVLLAAGVAVAVFGSYRLHVLQEQALEAQQLGQYRLKRRLGSGGMGEVYLAEHQLLRRPCALKLIRAEQAGDPTTMQRFEREVRAMATLTHWNTVEVFDYGHAEDGTFYYVMEYLPGQNLETLVNRHGSLTPGRAVHFLRQVCRALREAHGIGLLHRDVKPSNVIACQRGAVHDVAKLLDFGLVQCIGLGPSADKLTIQGAIVGSPPYMSPEQAAGKKTLDARSDVYSVGAVAYFLVTGQPPFVRDTPMQMLLAHAYEPVTPPSQLRPDLPADLEAIILGCLQKKPEHRFADAETLEKALGRCVCAAEWGEEQAAGWWKQNSSSVDSTNEEMSTLPTQVTAS